MNSQLLILQGPGRVEDEDGGAQALSIPSGGWMGREEQTPHRSCTNLQLKSASLQSQLSLCSEINTPKRKNILMKHLGSP